MGNKTKRSGIPTGSNDRVMSLAPNNIQSTDSTEIKQESDIKQEPVYLTASVEVSASTYRDRRHVPDSNQQATANDFDYLDLIENKPEVKKEWDDKKEEKSEANADSGEEATDGQREQQPPSQGEDEFFQPESDDNALNTSNQYLDNPENPQKQHKCDQCEYSTQFKTHLKRHLLKHTGERPHGCNLCSKRFTTKQHLNAHMKVHVEEHMFSCSVCLQGFDVKDEKVAHEMNCNTRRYECHLCKESFGPMKGNMMNHMRVHSGDKPFDCKECFKRFTEQGSLTSHMKLHAGPQPFRCCKCHQGFSRQDEKNDHEEGCSRQVYKCDICGKTFVLGMSFLIRHIRTHTGEKPFQCKECPKKFTQKSNLKRHMEIHKKKLDFECLVCRQGFSKNSKRKAHQLNCRGRHYVCHLCNKFFGSNKIQLLGHMSIHSGEKPFQCELCQNRFTEKGSLKRHVNGIHNQNH